MYHVVANPKIRRYQAVHTGYGRSMVYGEICDYLDEVRRTPVANWGQHQVEDILLQAIYQERKRRLIHQTPDIDPIVESRRSPSTSLLRKGLLSFLVIGLLGLGIMSLNMGFGLAILIFGFATFIVFGYAAGLKNGEYLISPRYSIIGIVFLTGLALTAIAAGIEFR